MACDKPQALAKSAKNTRRMLWRAAAPQLAVWAAETPKEQTGVWGAGSPPRGPLNKVATSAPGLKRDRS